MRKLFIGRIERLLYSCLILIICLGCDSVDDIAIEQLELRGRIESFSFSVKENPILEKDVEGVIQDSVILVQIPYILSDLNLRPSISIDNQNTTVINDNSGDGVLVDDFSKPVHYSVVDINSGNVLHRYTVYVTIYTGLPMMHINTDDKEDVTSRTEYKGAQLSITNAGEYNLSSVHLQIKGRGNTTWRNSDRKKPLRLKFDEKQSLFGEHSDKSWVLLSNYTDKTMLRNAIAFFMGSISDLAWTSSSHFVELYLNNEHMGTYQLCEKIKIAKHRVNTTGDGYLIEVDMPQRMEDDDVYFRTDRLLFNIKDPDIAQNSEKYNWICQFVNKAENVLFSESYLDKDSGYRHYLDVSSFVDWYVINEICKNPDSNFTSSSYMSIKPGGKLTMGPIWDYDLAFGNCNYFPEPPGYGPEGFWVNTGSWMGRLMTDPGFVELVNARFNFFYSHRKDIISFVDEKSTYLRHSSKENDKKWDILNQTTWPNVVAYGDYEKEVESVKDWINKRMDWLNDNLPSFSIYTK